MIETGTRPARDIKTRALGFLGVWLCAVTLFPLVIAWIQFINPHRPSRLPQFGSPAFWPMVGLDIVMASLATLSVTLSAMNDQKKSARRKDSSSATTPKGRLRQGLAGVGLSAFLVLRFLAANPGQPVNWGGVLGGAAALALLFTLLLWCASLTLPPTPPVVENAGESSAPTSVAWPPPIRISTPWPPPPNRYRVEANAREIVYRRPMSQRISVGVIALFFAGLSLLGLGYTLLSLGLIFVPGMHMRENPASALIMGSGCLLFAYIVLLMGAMTGPRELRVSPSDGTYTYRLSAPPRGATVVRMVDAVNRNEVGLPWRVVEYRGDVADMEGIQMWESTRKSTTSYSLLLRWKDSKHPALRVGHALKEDVARALQAQAAEDLGVPILPDEVV